MQNHFSFFFFSDTSLMAQYFNGKATSQKPHPVVNKLQTHLALASRHKHELAGQHSFEYSTPHFTTYTHLGNAPHLFKENHPKLANAPAHFATGIRVNFASQPAKFSNSIFNANAFKTPSPTYRHSIVFGSVSPPPYTSYENKVNVNPKHSNGPPKDQTTINISPNNSLPKEQSTSNNHNIFKPSQQVREHHQEDRYNSHDHQNRGAQNQYNLLSPVPPSVLTPFYQQVQNLQKQKTFEATTLNPTVNSKPQEKYNDNVFKPMNGFSSQTLSAQNPPSYPSNEKPFYSTENFSIAVPSAHSSYLSPITSTTVPQPISSSSSPTITHNSRNPIEILNKYKIPKISPLQDVNKFSYNIIGSHEYKITTPSSMLHPPSSSYIPVIYGDSSKKYSILSTSAPTDFNQVENTIIPIKDNPSDKPFSPTPYFEEKDIDNGKAHVATHSYFTIEDAMTVLPEQQTKFYEYSSNHPEVVITEATLIAKKEKKSENSTEIAIQTGSKQLDTPQIKQKARRKRPRPFTDNSSKEDGTTPVITPFSPRTRVQTSVDIVTTPASKIIFPTRERNDLKILYTPSVEQTSTLRPRTLSTTTTTVQLDGSKNRKRYNLREKISSNTTTITQLKFEEVTTPKNNPSNSYNNKNTRINTKLPNVKPILKYTKITPQRPSTTVASYQFSPTEDEVLTSTESMLDNTKSTRLKPINKFEGKQRPKFSIKDYRNKLPPINITATTEKVKPTESISINRTTRIKYPVRTRIRNDFKSKLNATTIKSSTDMENQIIMDVINDDSVESKILVSSTKRTKLEPVKEKPTSTTESVATNNIRRGSTRRDFSSYSRNKNTSIRPQTLITPTVTPEPFKILAERPLLSNEIKLRQPSDTIPKHHNKIFLQPIKENDLVDDNVLNDLSFVSKSAEQSTTESYKHETAIMKIAKDDSYKYKSSTVPSIIDNKSVTDVEMDLHEASSDYSKRIAELTMSVNKDHAFKFVNSGIFSRKIPGYFTIATEDPILPIEAFFPQFKRENIL
jgi:hypothetical protein